MQSFVGDPCWKHSVFSAIWFDSGFLFASAHEVRRSMVQQPWLSRSCSSSLVVDFPVVAQLQIHLVRSPQRFSSCSILIRWSTFVVHVQFSSAVVEEADLPQLQFLVFWTGCCMPVGVQRLLVDVP